jgi:hypothetical protein
MREGMKARQGKQGKKGMEETKGKQKAKYLETRGPMRGLRRAAG